MKPISCNHCKAVNASDARVCYQCKKILSIGSHAICGSCYHRNPLHLYNCVNCGMELNESIEKEVESAMAFEANMVSGGTGPLVKNGDDLESLNTSQEDPAFYEQVTKKHEIPEFAQNNAADNPPSDNHKSVSDLSNNPLDSAASNAENADSMDMNNNDLPDIPDPRALKNGKYEQHSEPMEEMLTAGTTDEEVDILSMLDLDLNQDKFVPEPPRTISEDQLQPTDWISELVPDTDELPTMADMLPDPLPSEPAAETDLMEMPGSVMDMLFGDTGMLGEDGAEEAAAEENVDLTAPSVPNFEPIESTELTAEPTDLNFDAPAEPVQNEAPDDSWLTDAMTDIEDLGNEESLDVTEAFEADADLEEGLPTWMDFSTNSDAETDLAAAGAELNTPEAELEPIFGTTAEEIDLPEETPEETIEEKANLVEEAVDFSDFSYEEKFDNTVESAHISDGMTTAQDFEDNDADDDDALNWLIDDEDDSEISAPAIAAEVESPIEPVDRLMQTRDLSESAIFQDLQDEAGDTSGIDESSAIQANVPNWIKQMAPASDQEPVAISNAETSQSQMDDDALSAILDSMDIDPEALAEPASLSLDEVAAKALNVHAEPEVVADEMVNDVLDIPEIPASFAFDTEPADSETADNEPAVSEWANEVDSIEEVIEPPLFVEEPEDAAVEEVESAFNDTNFDFDEDDFEVSEEDLVRDAISAIESEIRDIKDLEDDSTELDAESENPESTEWLSATDLNFKPAETAEESNTWFEEPEFESESEEVENAKIIESTIDPVEASDALAAFDWGDVETVFDSPDPNESLIVKAPDTAAAATAPFGTSAEIPSFGIDDGDDDDEEVEVEVEVDSGFDWLSEESFIEAPVETETGAEAEAEAESSEAAFSFAHDDAEEPDAESLRSLQIGVPHDTPAEIVDEVEITNELVSEAELSLENPFEPMDLLEEPAIEIPSSDLPLTIDTPAEEIASAIESVEAEIAEIEATAELDITPDVAEEFKPLAEFDDESDVFSTVRDQPPIENSISAESITPYDTSSFVNMPDPSGADSFSLHEENKNADEFFNSLAEDDQMEMPEWANELAPASPETKPVAPPSDNNPLSGISDVVDVAPSISNQVSDLQNLHAPQMMEPIAHRKRAQMAAQAAGTVPMTDPTQPVVVPKERQKYQPRFNATQFDGRPSLDKQKKNRQIGFLVVAGVIALAVIIAIAVPIVISLFNG